MFIRQELHEKIPKFNLLSNYLLPSLSIQGVGFSIDILKKLGYINAYLENPDANKKYENAITLIFNPSFSVLENNWAIFQKEMKERLPNYILTYDVDWCVIGVIMKMEDKYKHLLPLFIKGKYSEFGEKYAQHFILRNRQGGIERCLTQYKVIVQDKEYRESLEEKLNLTNNYLLGIELEETVKRKDLIFNYNEYV